ncbi:MAG TPA: carboxymuconolactone decarboxylase family protein [Pseudoxanthomonas sp.]|nr:carboxymuconolactone decarboxylase family protein [Pseudoxanthomonas sp.]
MAIKRPIQATLLLAMLCAGSVLADGVKVIGSGVKSGEISELITHLAFYSGWGNAMAAVAIAHEVLTHLAFYAGWPNVFSALPVAKEVFAKRAAD